MATEKLIVQLESDTKKLRADLDKVDDKLKNVDGSTSKADNSLATFGSTALKVGGVMIKAATAVIAVKAAIDAMVLSSARGRAEVEQLSRQVGLSVEKFQALSFATKQFGINAEQVADISKDVSDKLGEFATAGSGAFQDFADVMGMNKEEAVKLAKEYQSLTSDQVIGDMVKRMEDAGKTSNQLTFALESMGSDLSKLTPLFTDNASKLKELTGAYSAANKEMSLTGEQAVALREVATSFDLMSGGIENATTLISATLAPSLNEFFNSVIEVVPQATQTIIDFINSFQDAENIKSVKDLDTQIQKLQASAFGLQETIRGGASMDEFSVEEVRASQEQLIVTEERLNELYEARDALQKDIAANTKIAASGEGGTISASGVTSVDQTDAIKAIEDRFKTEEQLLVQKYEKEILLAANNKEALLNLETEFFENLMAMDEAADAARAEASLERWQEMIENQNQEKFDNEISEQQRLLNEKLINEEEYLKAVLKLGVKYGKVTEKDKKTTDKKLDASTWDTAKSAMDAAGAVFSNNKAVSSTLAFINTAEGVTAALAKYDFVGAAVIGATGAAQIASINSSTPGSTGSVTAPSAPSASTSDSRVSSSVQIDETTIDGGNVESTVNTVTITADDSDELAVAFANVMNNKIKSGELKLGG